MCKRCGGHKHYWDSYNKRWHCAGCGHETTLTADTVMHNSKLPLMYRFKAIHLLTSTKNTFSASEMQRLLGHKRCQPIWEMMHKLRDAMGKKTLIGNVEIDEGFFPIEVAEDKEDENPRNSDKPKKVSHTKMVVIGDLRSKTISPIAGKSVSAEASVVSDGTRSHAKFPEMFKEHVGRIISAEDIGKAPVGSCGNCKCKDKACQHIPWRQAGVSSGVSERVLLQVQPPSLW